MRLLKATAIAMICASGPALAEDFPQCFDKSTLTFADCPGYGGYYSYDWSGYYIGAHAGYADLDLSGGYHTLTPGAVLGADVDPNGFAGGGQAGVNYQQDFYVLGLEIDASAADMEASASSASGSVTAEVHGFGSIRARFGVAVDEFLPYVTAGAGLVSYEVTVNDTLAATSKKEEDSAFVGVIGGGLEIGVTEEVSIRGEGLYYYIDEDVDFTGPGAKKETITIEDLWTVRGGVNWRF